MSTFGRVFGHGFGIFFMGLGAVFLFLAMNDTISDWFDANSTCNYGDCSNGSARTTFFILGASFVVTGLISSLATEFAVRKTRSVVRSVNAAVSGGSFESMDGITNFLEPFGIKLDPAILGNVQVSRETFDLRGRHQGEVPTDPAGLSSYLKSVGVNIDESVLQNARVVRSGEPQPAPGATRPAPSPGPAVAGAPSHELLRERAIIVRKNDRGETAGNQRLLELEVEVQPAGRVPYRVTVASLVRSSLANLLIEGSSLNVRVDPNDRNSVTIDWAEN